MKIERPTMHQHKHAAYRKKVRPTRAKDYRRPDGSFYREIEDQYSAFEPYVNAVESGNSSIGILLGYSYIPELAFSKNESENKKAHEVPKGKQGYWFIEQLSQINSSAISPYTRTYLTLIENPNSTELMQSQNGPVYHDKKANVSRLLSRYGYLTEDLTTKELRDKWIGAGRIKIIDLQTNEVLAERKGYVLAAGHTAKTDHWQFYGVPQSELICPNTSLLQFLQTTLKPVQDFPTNEQLELIAKE